MQQGGQYGEVPPHARPNSASSTPNANTTHAHLFNLSHEVATAAGGLGLSSNPPSSISHAAASASTHQHHAGVAAHPYSLDQVHQHHHSLHQQQHQQQHYLHFQDHFSHHHQQQSLQPSSQTASQQQQIVDHSGTASSSSSPAGLHLHQSLQKQGMVPSISMGVQQHAAGGQESQQQMQQASILQQQYTQQHQQHTLGLGLESPKPNSIATLQQAARVQQQQQHQAAGSASQGSAAIATTVAATSGTVINVVTQLVASSSNLINSGASPAVSTMVTPNVLVAAAAAAMTGSHQLGIGANSNNNNKQQGDQGVQGAAGMSMINQDDMQDIALGVDELDKGGSGGNRWPRQETLALLKVRSEMDSSFRDSSLKRPLWDEVSRKLAELGYQRSAKKCKEKFENVHKYYKRTKEGKAGRQDGKNYRFFSELEALYGNAGNSQSIGDLNKSSAAALLLGSSLGAPNRTADVSARISNPATTSFVRPLATDATGLNFSSETSSSDDDNDDEYDDPSDAAPESKKRKRKTLIRMMSFFESLLKQVMEKQEQMQQRFLDALERREQDRMIREEAWKRQEMARMSRENDLRAQERSLAATRDAAIVAFLQKVTGQTVQLPTTTALAIAAPPVQVHPPHHVPMVPSVLDPTFHHIPEDQDPFDPNSKRWPKPEVLALIKLRTGLHSRFTEPGPKGPLWEDIANGMSCLGYNRNAKRCKEKWENINKYFKKAKESNKNRPENAKTCPYYHQLDALYKQGVLGSGGIGNSIKALPYKATSDNLDNVQNAMIVHQASSRGGRVEGDLVAHGSTSANQLLAIMPPATQMSTASDATASTDNVVTPVAKVNTAMTDLFSASNPDNSGEDMSSKDINVHTAGGISANARPVDVNMSETNLTVDNPPRVDQPSEDISMLRTGLEMQRVVDDPPQHSRSTSNQGYMEHKVDLEQDARQLLHEEDEAQQKQQVLLQAQIQQYQQEMRVSSAALSQSGLATQSFIANMLQKFNNDPAESNTSTASTNQEH
ncbi:hypothetical protein L7F22_044284 [Adiantum nelumboides]|nr:hypothetical protein [Adiantum nelumboides]